MTVLTTEMKFPWGLIVHQQVSSQCCKKCKRYDLMRFFLNLLSSVTFKAKNLKAEEV